MIAELVDTIKKAGVRYCILHGWQSLPEYLPSDLDIIVAPQDLDTLEKQLCARNGSRLVQLLQHESSCYYFVLANRNGEKIRFIPVDAAVDYRRDGFVFFSARELLANHEKWNGLSVASPAVEFAYLLVKRVSKASPSDDQKARLQQLRGSLGEEGRHNVQHLFGSRLGKQVILWLEQSNWEMFETHFSILKRALHWQTVKRDPLNVFRYWLPEVRRIWRRWCYPTGLFVAVLGPDGAGKSTLIEQLRVSLAGAFRRTEVFHSRPNVLGGRRTNGPVTDPHGQLAYPVWLSLLKIPYYILDYCLGYLCKLRPRLVRSTFVLFDRYYDDLLVDPRRSRYGGPSWAVHLGRRFIPRPDLFLVLDAPEEQLLARKQEVSLEELRRQRKAYQRLAAELPNAMLLDGSLPPEQVLRHANETVLSNLHERYLKRRHIWFSDDSTETLNWLASVLTASCVGKGSLTALDSISVNPTKQRQTNDSFRWLALGDGRGYLFPLGSRKTAVSGLDLYNAQTLRARLAKKVLTVGLRLGVAQPFLRKVYLTVPRNGSQRVALGGSFLEHLKLVLGEQDLRVAISLGTPGPHRKPMLEAIASDGTIIGYVKVGWNEVTNNLVKNEARTLRCLADVSSRSFTVPAVLYEGSWEGRYFCVQSPPQERTVPAPRELTPQYFAVQRELAAFHTRSLSLTASTFWEKLSQQIEIVQNPYYRHVLEQGAERVQEWFGERPLPFHICHGDFAPWNIKRVNGRLFLFDWEYSTLEAPPGYDLLHFAVQTAKLLQKSSPGELVKAFRDGGMAHKWLADFLKSFSLKSTNPVLKTNHLLLLYLLERLAFYASDNQDAGSSRCFANVATLVMLEETTR